MDEASDDWSKLFDELKMREGISSDAELAASLGVTPAHICSVRKGRKRLSLRLAEIVMSRVGLEFQAERLERLFAPAKVRARVRDMSLLKQLVIDRASGHCQLCGSPAPFELGGIPYLELHHIIPVHDEGQSTPLNVVALCPNCHRKMQHAATETDIKNLRIAANEPVNQ
jgi:hypothetical protein